MDLVTVTLDLTTEGRVALAAHGRSRGKRADLWRYNEIFGEANSDLAPHDAAAHLLLVALQDRPRTLEALSLGLRGHTLWEDVELPLD